MTLPWHPVAPVRRDQFADIRRRAIFECCKWDPHMEDASAIASAPLILTHDAWDALAAMAQQLAAETIAAERELLARPELHSRLALPRAVRRALASITSVGAPRDIARLMRFDFHHTMDGWRISEANTDVPGGLNEASGFAALFAPHFPGAVPVGDPVAAYADAIASRLVDRGEARVALVHATAFTDDRQVMTYLADALSARGIQPVLTSPSQLRWHDGHARCACDWSDAPVDAIVRFFPGEWLPNLDSQTGWTHFLAGSRTPLSNPATALLTQSKRFPLVWNELDTPLAAWKSLLPETLAPGDCSWRREEWVLKPALGRVGEDIALRGVIPERQWSKLARSAWLRPWHWVAQRRFDAVPLSAGDATLYPCVGVYTVDGRAAGAYGRVASRPLIDWRAQDAAVMRGAPRGDRTPWQ